MRLPRYLRLLLRPPTLDFETATWEMFYLLVSPKKVFRAMYYRQQTKDRWSRDDPSFVILMSVLLMVSALAWGLAYSPSIIGVLKLVLYMVVVDFLAVGVVVSTIAWALISRFLQKPGSPGASTEWAFCFDVHCNAFLVIWIYLYVLQFALLPVVERANWFSIFLGNTLYFVAISHYFIITFMGYSNLHLLVNAQVFLVPIAVALIVYILCCLSGFSVVRFMLSQYFNI